MPSIYLFSHSFILNSQPKISVRHDIHKQKIPERKVKVPHVYQSTCSDKLDLELKLDDTDMDQVAYCGAWIVSLLLLVL